MPRRPVIEPTRLRVGRHVIELRAHLGLSQSALGEIAGLDRSFIGTIERGERNVSADTIDRLAYALGVDAADLIAPKAARRLPQRA